MKQRMFILALGLAFASLAVRAQESDVRVGLGVSFAQNLFIGSTTNLYYPVNFTTFSIPLFLTKNFRIEPDFGLLTYSDERTLSDKSVDGRSSTQMRIGMALQYMIRNLGGSENVAAYVGPHVDILPTSTKDTFTGSVDRTSSRTDLVIGLECGGEYSFAKCFSIGGEVQLNYIGIGETTTSPPSSSTTSESEHFINVSSSVVVRWFFN